MSSLLLSGLLLIIPLSLAASYQYDILVIRPDDPTRYGTNGEAMLTAVQFATERLHVMQLPFTLNIRNLVTTCSSRTSSPVKLTRELTKTSNNSLTIAVIGYFCEGTLLDLELIGVAHPDRLGLVEISVNTFLPVVSEARLRSLYYQTFPSSLYYTEALAQFMDSVGWNKIGIAYTELINSYHFQVSQQVLKGLVNKGLGPIKMFKVTDSAHTKTSHNITQTVKEIHVSGVKIVYVLLSPTDTTLLLCTAYENGLRWPDYAWITSDISSWDFENLKDCDSHAAEGVLSFQTILSDSNPLSGDFNMYSDVLDSNIHARALYDSIMATAFSLNQSFPRVKVYLTGVNTSLGSTKSSMFRAQRTVSQIIAEKLDSRYFTGSETKSGLANYANIAIFQTTNGAKTKLGHYELLSNSTSFENYTIPSVPSDTLSREYTLLPVPIRVMLLCCLALCALLSLANTLLYLYYRKEPEIKASSVGLSMLMHLSCLFFMIGCANELRQNDALVLPETRCTIRIWVIYPWGDLMLATMLVKVCRIYHIFHHFSTIKRVCSDTRLLLLIASIVLGKITTLSVWTVVDRYRVRETEIYRSHTIPPHFEVVGVCYSQYYPIWATVSLSYSATLGAILAILAFKVRKIHRGNFKDTKKINATLAIALISVTVILTVWWVFRIENNSMGIMVLFPSLYLIIPASVQVCLFCPKTIPPVLRSLLNVCTQHEQLRRFSQERVMFLRRPNLPHRSLSSPQNTTKPSTFLTALSSDA